MSIIRSIDLNLVCLVCLKDEGELRSVFESDEQTPQLPIVEKISRCSELQIQQEENNQMPDKICERCLRDLAAVWRFRTHCEYANLVLRSFQEEEEAETMTKIELAQQQIKLPSGLKIKRIHMLPVQLEETDVAHEEMLMLPQPVETTADHILTEQLNVEETENQADSEINDDDFDGYYETEEVQEMYENVHNELSSDELHVKSENNTEKDNVLETVDDVVCIDATIETQMPSIELKSKEISSRYIKKVHEIKKEQEENSSAEEMEEEISADLVTTQAHEHERFKRYKKYTNVDKLKKETKSSNMKSEVEHAKEDAPITAVTQTTEIEHHLKSIKMPPPTFEKYKTKRKSTLPPSESRPPKICEICGNSYKYQHALNAHMRRHNNDRPFACEFCEKKFVSAVELRRHMRVHTGAKPYPCQHCERRFSDYGSRIKHERTHTGERPYSCYTCGKSFAYAHVLTVHERTHTGEKKFQCTRCGRGFTKKAYLLTHMAQHARDTVSDEDLNGGELMAIKTVAMEECIFTTEYIDDDDEDDAEGDEHNDHGKRRQSLFMVEVIDDDNMAEEHLDDGNDLIVGMR